MSTALRPNASGNNPTGWYSVDQHGGRMTLATLTLGFGETNTFPGYESATWFRCTEIEATLGRSQAATTTRTVACPDSIRRAMPKDFHQG